MNDKEIHWENESLTELVNYILKNHHGYLKKEMPLLSKLTTTILKVHGSDHRELSQVHRLFHIIKINFDQHNIIQEKNILPLIKIYERRPSKETLIEILEEIDLLGKEQDDIEYLLKELRKVTNEYTAPEDGCATYDRTFESLRELDSNIREHLHLENNILLPRLKNELNKY